MRFREIRTRERYERVTDAGLLGFDPDKRIDPDRPRREREEHMKFNPDMRIIPNLGFDPDKLIV